MNELTFHFSRAGAALLSDMRTVAYALGVAWLWTRLAASRTHLNDGRLRYLVETPTDPLAGAVVLAEDEAGDPLVTVSWDHPDPGKWRVTNWGTPLDGKRFNRFTPEELQTLFGIISTFDAMEVAA